MFQTVPLSRSIRLISRRKTKGRTGGAPVRRILALLIVVILSTGHVHAEYTLRTAEAEFDRCHARIERAERTVRRLESQVKELLRLERGATTADENVNSAAIATLESKVQFFHNRLERSRGQADKIRTDLRNASGATCPSCVKSSIDLYCRNAEHVLTESEEHLEEARRLASVLQKPTGTVTATNTSDAKDELGNRLERLHALAGKLAPILDTCSNSAGIVLRDQALKNIAKADSLVSVGSVEASSRAADIAENLVRKAANQCEGE